MVLSGKTMDIPEVPATCRVGVDGSFWVLNVFVSDVSTSSVSSKLWRRIILKLTPPEVVDFVSPRFSVAPTHNTKTLYLV